MSGVGENDEEDARDERDLDGAEERRLGNRNQFLFRYWQNVTKPTDRAEENHYQTNSAYSEACDQSGKQKSEAERRDKRPWRRRRHLDGV